MKKILGILILMTLLVPAPTLAANGEGNVEGTIINGTNDGNSTAGIIVTLRQFQDEVELDSYSATTDSDGAFLFTGLDTSESLDYRVYVDFGGVGYSSDLVNFAGETKTLAVDLQVYDTTTDTSVITTAMSHIIASWDGNIVDIKEIYVIVNISDRTFIGSPGTDSPIFPLPAGARNITYSDGTDSHIVLADGGFEYSRPLSPGEYQEFFTYELDIEDGQFDISRQYPQAVMQLDFLINGEGLDVSSNILVKGEPLSISGISYDYYQASGVLAGTDLELNVFETGAGTGIKSYLWLFIVLGVAVIFFLIWFYYLRRNKDEKIEIVEDDEIQGLISELALLDDSYEQGKMSRDDYQKQRDAKKAKLVGLMGSSD